MQRISSGRSAGEAIDTRAGTLGSLVVSDPPKKTGQFAGKRCKGRGDKHPCITRLNMYNTTGYCYCCLPDR